MFPQLPIHTHLRKSKLMVEYWFCMSAQSAQKKWDACKQARKSQPCKATPVITLRQRDTTTAGGVLQS